MVPYKNIKTNLHFILLWLEVFIVIGIVHGGVINREIIDNQSHATPSIKGTTEAISTIFTPSISTTTTTIASAKETDIKTSSSTETKEKLTLLAASDFTTISNPIKHDIISQQKENHKTLSEMDYAKMVSTTEPNISTSKILGTTTLSKMETIMTAAPTIVAYTTTISDKSTKLIMTTPHENIINSTEIENFSNDDMSITLGVTIAPKVTTELPHFDINRYTFNDIKTATTNKSPKQTTTEFSHKFTTIDYQNHFNQLILTTPTSFTDKKSNFYDENNITITEISKIEDGTNQILDFTTPKTISDSNLNDIKLNTTTVEQNTILITHESSLENTNYDIVTNEIRNITTRQSTPTTEKRGKYMKDIDTNLTIPNTAEVWALASMKNVEHTNEKNGQYINLTNHNIESEINSNVSTKLLADWQEIVKNENLNNDHLNVVNSNENILEKELKKSNLKEQLEQENQIKMITIDPPTSSPSVTQMISKTTTAEIVTTTNMNLIENTPSVGENKVDDIDDIDISKDNQNINKNHHEKLLIRPAIITPYVSEVMSTSEIPNKVDIIETSTLNNSEIDETTISLVETTVSENFAETEVPNNISLFTTLSSSATETTSSEIPTTIASTLSTTSFRPEVTSETSTIETIYTTERKTIASKLTTEPDSYEIFSSSSFDNNFDSKSTFDRNKFEQTISSTISTEFIPNTENMSTSSASTSASEITETIFDTDFTSQTVPTKQGVEYSLGPYFRELNNTDGGGDEISPITHDPQLGGVTESMDSNSSDSSPDYNVIIAIAVSVIGIIALILLVGFLYVMRKRQKQITYGQRCRPVSLDAYSLDNVSVFNSVRRKGALRASKKTYGNAAFDDPSLKHNTLSVHELAKFVDKKLLIYEEFKDIPQIISRPDEVPPGCEDKNRYANVIPLPETRVILEQQNNDEKTEYINANFVRGPKDPPNYYIACQGPLETTINDFWRMMWEQNSRVIIMATDLIENGKEKCAEYIPQSITLDNHVVFGDFQITLKSREVKEKYAVSTLHVKNMITNTWREITHFWYQWPDTGVPSDEASVIAMLLEARSCLKMTPSEQTDDNNIDEKNSCDLSQTNGNLEKTKSQTNKTQGPLTIHCSPGTGRTGTIIACDMALRSLETPKRSLDIPQIVYYVRRGRASAIQTKEQYEFIYKAAHMYATKISGPINDN